MDSTSSASFGMISSDSSIYNATFLLDDDAKQNGEPPRKIVTDYAALEAALEKSARDSENSDFPVLQAEKQQATFWCTFCPIQSGCWEDPYTVHEPEPEPQIFNSLPPPPRPSRHFKKE